MTPKTDGTSRPKQAAVFRRKLLAWYRAHRRDLPWRGSRDPYRIWISEVMLQQTTVSAVIPYFQRWMERFPDVASLSRASLQEVLRAWQGLGYYRRARNLHQAARTIVSEHEGRIPVDYATLRSLPGFGPYTTAAVLSIAFSRPFPVVDANVRRVGMRLIGLRGEAATPRDDQTLLAYLEPMLPSRNPGAFNQALMELGALVCRAKNPACLICPLSEFCRAYARGEQEIIPRPRRRISIRLEAVIGIIREGDRYLIQKRPDSGLLAGLWEFPGGKLEPNEAPEQALRRELREELGVDMNDADYLTTVEHAYTQFRVRLHAYVCRLSRRPKLKRDTHRWVTLSGMRRYPFASGSVRIIKRLESGA